MGLKVGKNSQIGPGVVIDYSHCWLIEIGDNVSITNQVMLLAHDASTKRLKDFEYTKVGSIKIEDNAFIGVRSLIMPGVTIGKNSIVAGGSVVTKSVPPDTIVGGIQAKKIGTLDQYEESRKKHFMNTKKIYEKDYTISGNIDHAKKIKCSMN
ncbi:acyltransferase [Halobacillus sp. SY10]|uniref:acyltransferase n=1 Tax=Halobacillus sp. SY10 TaxID=3381356 RepID=UPI00387988FC